MSDSIAAITIHCKENQTILEVCQEQGIFVEGICGGRGTCGKCKVKVISGEVPITEKDSAFFTKDELEEGYRLACRAHPLSECSIEITNESAIENAQMQILTDDKPENGRYKDITGEEEALYSDSQTGKKAIVIDIGTTTIAMQLISYGTSCVISCGTENEVDITKDYKVIANYGAVNEQRSFGGDVISRIQASVEGKGEKLKESILKNLVCGITKLTQAVQNDKIDRIVIAGNTTMIHLLMGYSCETLGVAPFVPVTTQPVKVEATGFFSKYLDRDLHEMLQGTEVFVCPGISAFIGGDIVVGLFETKLVDTDVVQMFVDLGTNAEMAIGSRRKLLVASAAAGPAFEGGNIACGMASVKGAICGAKLCEEGTWELQTIEDGEPAGICGTGVIEILSELLRVGRIDETGLLDDGETDQVMLSDKIYFTQQDIRMLQMAKAAICAGLETLIKEYGISAGKIEKVYVAGGFGYYVNIQKAVSIGLFPKELCDKIAPVGNSVLAGAKSVVTGKEAGYQLERIRKMATEVNLAKNEYFKEAYIDNMYF